MSDRSKLAAARGVLKWLKGQTCCVGLAFSGGKDSLCSLDLLIKEGFKVVPYYLYRVAGLEITNRLCALAEVRYGVEVVRLSHFDLAHRYRNAVLQPHWVELDGVVPALNMRAIDDYMRSTYDLEWLVYGWRRSDSLSRGLTLASNHGMDPAGGRVFPLARWNRQDVLAYLKLVGIPQPPSFGLNEQGGVDFRPVALAYLKERFPNDYAKIKECFPFVETQTGRAPTI